MTDDSEASPTLDTVSARSIFDEEAWGDLACMGCMLLIFGSLTFAYLAWNRQGIDWLLNEESTIANKVSSDPILVGVDATGRVESSAQFKYTVNGEEYYDHFDVATTSHLQSIPTTLRVYYHADDPSRARTWSSAHPFDYFELLAPAAVLLLLVGVAILGLVVNSLRLARAWFSVGKTSQPS